MHKPAESFVCAGVVSRNDSHSPPRWKSPAGHPPGSTRTNKPSATNCFRKEPSEWVVDLRKGAEPWEALNFIESNSRPWNPWISKSTLEKPWILLFSIFQSYHWLISFMMSISQKNIDKLVANLSTTSLALGKPTYNIILMLTGC